MSKSIEGLVKKYKENLFAWMVCVYIYVLYVRGIYLSYRRILKQIDKDVYNHVLNHWQELFNNQAISADAAIILYLVLVIFISFYLLYKRSKYFYAVLLSPLFFGLLLLVVTPIFMWLSFY